MTIDEARDLLDRSLTELKKLRNGFDDVVEEAKVLAGKWDIEPSLPTKRITKSKAFLMS